MNEQHPSNDSREQIEQNIGEIKNGDEPAASERKSFRLIVQIEGVIIIVLLLIIAGILFFLTYPENERRRVLVNMGVLPTPTVTASATLTVTVTPTTTLTPTFTPTPTPTDTPTPTATPLAGATAITKGDSREILVLIAQFEQTGEKSFDLNQEWKRVFDQAVEQYNNLFNAKVYLIPYIIHSHDEARAVSDLYQATMVIWGTAKKTVIDSQFTVTPRWDTIDTYSDQIQFLHAIPEFSLSVLPSENTKYISNFVLGLFYYFAEGYDKALSLLSQAVEQTPPERRRELGANIAYFYIGNIYRWTSPNDSSMAITAYTAAVEVEPKGITAAYAYNNRGGAHVNQQQSRIMDYTSNRFLYLDLIFVLDMRAIPYDPILLDAGIADFTQAIDISPYLVTAYFNRGILYSYRGWGAEAMADFNQTIALQPGFAAAYFYRGNVYQDGQQLESAINNYTQAITLQPDYAEAYNNRGVLHYYQGDLNAALLDCSQAIGYQPDFAFAYFNRGLVYSDQREKTKAIADYTQAIALKPDYDKAYWGRGNAYYDLGDFIHSIADYRQYEHITGSLAETMVEQIAEMEAQLTPTPEK
ncbi:MAG TPA: tetratricopeptide repeat protein [Phototrophicaceae bacterium]|nr:tetratricopeptide repeat protein [Phototrophicaceae bacterium]